jgi:hypothetical protein
LDPKQRDSRVGHQRRFVRGKPRAVAKTRLITHLLKLPPKSGVQADVIGNSRPEPLYEAALERQRSIKSGRQAGQLQPQRGESGGLGLFPTLFAKSPSLEQPSRPSILKRKMTQTARHNCQHTTSLRLTEEFRRTAGGHTEADGKTVVCGSCGDSWHFRDRVQLPEWLRQELTDRGL